MPEPNCIALDSNLLVLLVVGSNDRSLIGRHKRTAIFEEADYDLLANFLSQYELILVTPHVLAEASNLIGQIGEPLRSRLMALVAAIIPNLEEHSEGARDLVRHREFVRLGLTDCGILTLSRRGVALLTTDLDLYLAASKTNNQAHNFNHLRQRRLLGD